MPELTVNQRFFMQQSNSDCSYRSIVSAELPVQSFKERVDFVEDREDIFWQSCPKALDAAVEAIRIRDRTRIPAELVHEQQQPLKQGKTHLERKKLLCPRVKHQISSTTHSPRVGKLRDLLPRPCAPQGSIYDEKLIGTVALSILNDRSRFNSNARPFTARNQSQSKMQAMRPKTAPLAQLGAAPCISAKITSSVNR